MTPDLPKVEVAIVELTNAFRRENRLAELKRNATLDQAARAFAQYLARTGKFSHTADGRQPTARSTAAGYKHCSLLENLASNLDSRGFESRQLAREAIEGWKKSPPHRKAMIEPGVTEIGVGVARARGEHRYLSVQLFARPRALQYDFVIRNITQQRVTYAHGGRQQEVGPGIEVTHTACNPAELRFFGVKAAGLGAGAAARFATRDGDLFVVGPNRQGTPVVTHRPRVN